MRNCHNRPLSFRNPGYRQTCGAVKVRFWRLTDLAAGPVRSFQDGCYRPRAAIDLLPPNRRAKINAGLDSTIGAHMRNLAVGTLLTVMPLVLHAQDLSGLPAPLVEKVTAGRKACEDFNDGKFSLEWGAVVRTDLDGDPYLDWVLNESGFACSSAASLYCGTGGCESHFLVGETVTSLLTKGWEMVTFFPHRVLLAHVHGSRCGGSNPTPCVESLVWDREDKVWRSIQHTTRE